MKTKILYITFTSIQYDAEKGQTSFTFDSEGVDVIGFDIIAANKILKYPSIDWSVDDNIFTVSCIPGKYKGFELKLYYEDAPSIKVKPHVMDLNTGTIEVDTLKAGAIFDPELIEEIQQTVESLAKTVTMLENKVEALEEKSTRQPVVGGSQKQNNTKYKNNNNRNQKEGNVIVEDV